MKKITPAILPILCTVVFLSCSQQYIVKVNSGEGGLAKASVTGIPGDSLTVQAGDTVILTAMPDGGYIFGSWMVFGVGDGHLTATGPHSATFIMPEKDVAVHVNFQKDPRIDYYGSWAHKEGNNEDKITLTEDLFVRELTLEAKPFLLTFTDTLDNLIWEPIRNPGGEHTADYPSGYRIIGTIVKASTPTHTLVGKQGEAQPGDTAVVWYYLRQIDKGALMKGNSDSQAHEAAYNPLIKLP